MNTVKVTLLNGENHISPFEFDNNQILQDSVTPEAPSSTSQIPAITQVAEPPRFKVSYHDQFIGLERSRRFATLEEAISFITYRACRPMLYNHFLLEILE
jgi:hypothetical protein